MKPLGNRQAATGRVGTPKFGVLGGLEDVEALADTKYVEDKVVGIQVDAESADDKAVADLATAAKASGENKAVEALSDVKPISLAPLTLSLSR